MNLVHPHDGDEVEAETCELVTGSSPPLNLDFVLDQVLAAMIHHPLKELLVVLLCLHIEGVQLQEAGRGHLSTIQTLCGNCKCFYSH